MYSNNDDEMSVVYRLTCLRGIQKTRIWLQDYGVWVQVFHIDYFIEFVDPALREVHWPFAVFRRLEYYINWKFIHYGPRYYEVFILACIWY